MKYLFYLLLIVIIIMAISWTFNHIHAWAGVGLFVAIVFAIVYYFKKIT